MTVRHAHHRKFDPDRRRHVVMVLDLGVGQSGALDRRPHHRLGAAIQLARVLEAVEFLHDGGFGGKVHRGVAVGEITGDAEAQELVALQVDEFACIFTAGRAELFFRDLVLAAALLAVFFLDLPFDGQAVAVPARHVVDVIAHQETRTDHEVLQRLVQGVTDVDVTVGIGRAVVQHIQRSLFGLTLGAQGAVQVAPFFEDFRLLLRQAAAHRKIGFRQEDGVAVIAARRSGVVGVGHGLSFSSMRTAPPQGMRMMWQSSVK